VAIASDIALFLLRVVTGFMVWQHGAQKLFGMLGGAAADMLTPAWIGGVIEFVGGIALAAGFLTRTVALIVAVDMAVIYVTQYLPLGFPPILNRQGEVTCLIFCTTVVLAVAGPGKASVDRTPRRSSDALDIVRVLMGFLFFCYGLRKMFGLLGEDPEPFLSLQWYAGVIELFGGAAIMAGLFTRPVAFLCSGEMAFAYFINHNPRGFFPIQNGGERAALFCFYFLFLSAVGAGKWSLDARLGRRARPERAGM
jgi:putative oxidoreductase